MKFACSGKIVATLALALVVSLPVGKAQAAAVATEYARQPNLAQIHVSQALHDAFYKAYVAPSVAKSKIMVAILDGVADYTHSDLSGRETDIAVYKGTYKKFDDHATHVSGMIGASENGSGVAGIDPFATMLNIPVFDDKGWVATDNGKLALDYAAAQNVRVVNMSYGASGRGTIFLSGELNLFKTYNSTTAGKGMLIVRAGGNDGSNAVNQSFIGDASVLLSNLLLVGSVDSKNVISSFSNRPGNACIGGTKFSCSASDANAMMNFWLVAPGENILSDVTGNAIASMSGTSMATPQVVGAAALVYQQALAGNKQLTPGDVAGILKKSADDLGTAGVDAVYGWGLLDVARALGPVGGVSFPTGGNATSSLVPAQKTSVTSSSVMSKNALQNALSGMIVLDAYGRAFNVSTPEISRSSPLRNGNFVQSLSDAVSSVSVGTETGDGAFLSLTASGDVNNGGMRVTSFDNGSLHLDGGVASSYFFTTPNMPSRDEARTFSRGMAQDFYAGGDSISGWLDRAMFVGADIRTSPRWTFSGVYLHTTPTSNLNGLSSNLSLALTENQNASSMSIVKFGINYLVADGVWAGVYSGYLAEEGQLMGMRASGAFSLGNGATYISGVKFRAELSAATSISAFAERSTTSGNNSRNSLFSTDNWHASKYGVSLSQSGVFNSSGVLRVTLLRPWQVDSGSINVHLPVGRELDDTINYEDRRVSVAGDKTPVELGLAYLDGTETLKYGVELKYSSAAADRYGSEASLAASVRWNF